MATNLPRFLMRNCTLWADSESKLGQIGDITPPVPQVKVEEMRNAGMVNTNVTSTQSSEFTQGVQGTVGAAIGFESAFADVKKVVNGTSQQLESFRQDILGLSKEMPITASGFAEIYAAAGQSGIANEELKTFAKTVAQVSTAWDVPVKETGQALAEIKTQLHLGVAQVGLFADALNHLSNNSAANAPKLLEFTNRVASQGEMFGFTAEQSLAFGGAMIAAGAESEVAATSFRNMGNALTAAGTASKSKRDAFKRIGLDANKTAKSMQKNALQTTLDVIDRIQQLPEWERISIARGLFGDEARALMPLINNSGELRRQLGLVSSEANYAGSAVNEYGVRAKTTANQLQLVRNNLAALGIQIGDRMLPAINRALSGVLGIFSTLGERVTVFDKIGTAIQGFVNGLSGGGGFSEMMKQLEELFFGKVDGSAAADQMGRIFKQFKDWGTWVRELSSAIAENPIARFFAGLAPYGFQIMLWGAGIAFLAGTVRKLAAALMLLSGASTILATLKALKGLAGIAGIGGTAATATAGATGAAGAAAGAATAGKGILSRVGALFAGLTGLAAATSLGPGGVKKMTPEQSQYFRDRLPPEPATDSSRGGFLKRLLFGSAADENFSFKNHMGIETKAAGGMRIDASSIAAITQPTGTQDVRVTNPPQPVPPVVNQVNNFNITGVQDPVAAGQSAAAQVGQAAKAGVEASLAGNPAQ